MGIRFLSYNSAIFCPILMKLHIQVQDNTSYKKRGHNWAKKGPNMGVAVPQALVGDWGPGDPLESLVTDPSLFVNCYLGNKFDKEFRLVPPPLSIVWQPEGQRILYGLQLCQCIVGG